jgi:hypothetical protein
MEPGSAMADSRAATNALLAELREDRLAPEAVVRFLGQAAHRSLLQAARRPRALTELTAPHAVLYTLAADRRPGRRWVARAALGGRQRTHRNDRDPRIWPGVQLHDP